MSDLPDIDTDDVQHIAFYNAIDELDDIDEVDPEQALEDGSLEEYTLYDNGWEGTWDPGWDRDVTVRAKTDGWFVAYLEGRPENYDQDIVISDHYGALNGPWDMVYDWQDAEDEATVNQNTLERAIRSLLGHIDDFDSSHYDPEDVGFYSYHFDAASMVTLFRSTVEGDDSVHAFLYTDGTDIEHASLWASAITGDSTTGSATSRDISITWDETGVDLVDIDSVLGADTRCGTKNVEGDIDPDTEYDISVEATEGTYNAGKGHFGLLAFWS